MHTLNETKNIIVIIISLNFHHFLACVLFNLYRFEVCKTKQYINMKITLITLFLNSFCIGYIHISGSLLCLLQVM